MKFTHAILDNGLTIVAEVNESAASMAAGFFVRTGSRDETPEISGVSHYLEHMVFKGTPRRSAAEVNLEFDDMGANYNAFTSEENTVYFGAVLPEYQNRLIDLLADILRPALRQGDFDLEKNVIIEEIAVYEDQPRFRVYDNLMSEYFKGHPLGRSILGTRETIGALKRQQMLDYFNRRYSPGNVTVVAVGKLNFDELVDKIRRACSHWKSFDVHRDTPPPPPGRRGRVIVDAKLSRQHIGMFSPAPSAQDNHRFAAQLLSTIIGDETGSRFYYALVDPAIADDATMTFDPMDQAGGFLTFISADPSRAVQAAGIARDEMHKFVKDGPTDAEMQAAKNKIASGATLKGELPMGRLSAVGFDWVYRRQYVPLAEQIEMLFAVTREQVIEIARQYDLTATTMLTLGPLEKVDSGA